MRNCPLPAFASLKLSMMHSSDGVPAFSGASAGRGPGSREPSRKASRPSGFDPSRDHESLAGGTRPRSRRHFIPASLSLPFFGCLLNRSRDCSRSRVPPRFRVGAMLTLLRLPLFSACASLQRDLTGPPVGMAKLQAGLAVQLSSGELARFVWAPGCTETPLFLLKG